MLKRFIQYSYGNMTLDSFVNHLHSMLSIFKGSSSQLKVEIYIKMSHLILIFFYLMPTQSSNIGNRMIEIFGLKTT